MRDKSGATVGGLVSAERCGDWGSWGVTRLLASVLRMATAVTRLVVS